MTSTNFDETTLQENAFVLKRECNHLRQELNRLQKGLYVQEQRVGLEPNMADVRR